MRLSDYLKLTEESKKEIILNLWRLRTTNSMVLDRVDKLVSDKCPTCDDRKKYIYKGKGYECDCTLQKLLSRTYLSENIGKKYHTLCLDDYVGVDAKNIVPVIEDYVENFEDYYRNGIGITFNGPIGTGKSMSISIILKALTRMGHDCFFIAFDDLVNASASNWKSEEDRWLDERIKTVKVLGLDEIKTDARNVNGFLSQMVERVIRFRTDNNLPTLVTTNLTENEEYEKFNKSHSLLSEKNLRVTTHGEDVRGNIIRDRTMKIINERKPIW